ncbi:MAG: dihydroorotate dehydrogenase electron transfer subunit [Candidatus Dormiibacterota bacterium]
MTADLSRAALETGEVLVVERLGGGLLELVVRLPHLAATAMPGMFAQLRCGRSTSPLLRRPFSVAWTQDDTCGFIFEAVGAGTRLLAELEPGDPLDILGPLGHGFSVADGGSVVCVSGGLGCAPFPLLINELRRRGVEDILVLNGARTATRLYPAERFARPAVPLVAEATDDGTRGHRGYVTDLLRQALESHPSAIYACGPNAMLGAVMRTLLESGADLPPTLEASLEAPMGCGFGTCLGCALPVRGEDGSPAWRLCCTDGPVMPMRDVDWDALRALPGADVA